MKHALTAAGLVLACVFLSACTSDHLLRTASTLEVGYAHGDFAPQDALGVPNDGNMDAVIFTIRPLIWLEPPAKVIVVERPVRE